ncbi:MAG: hypothetical protein LAP87_18425 [Acidobacteriia bacterium]|nr:hypothetical protein [Terriglobia bacterium]
MPRLRVELLSPLAAGSGLGRPGVVDRDVIHDPRSGLVSLPGRRLKGLLRDSYDQIRRWKAFGDANLPETEDVFGSAGEKPSRVEIGNAQIAADNGAPLDGAAAAAELRRIIAAKDSPIRLQEVLECFTEIRRQTAIERATGAAAKDTLRYTRVLRQGLVFEAAIDSDSGAAMDAVAMAAAGVQWMGTARSRGWGKVHVSVVESDRDLTKDVLHRLRTGGSLPDFLSAAPGRETADPAGAGGPIQYLAFSIRLREPAMFPDPLAGDPNTTETFEHIPGGVIHGALAARFLRQYGAGERFYQLFCSRRVCFLPATPALQEGGAGPRASRYIPHSLRGSKDARGQYRDLSSDDPAPEFSVRVPGWYWKEEWENWKAGMVGETRPATAIQYHHQRAHDSRVQRAVGEEAEQLRPYALSDGQGGALFVYESLQPDQLFSGCAIGPEEDLNAIRALLDDGAEVRLGRSRSTQYGGRAEWMWHTAESIAPAKAPAGEGEGDDARIVYVYLLTPLIARNSNGHPTAEFPMAEFERVTGTKGVRIERAYTRRQFHGGYYSHQNLQKEQAAALAEGSVFVLGLPEPATEKQLQDALSHSYGQRTAEGFGRIELYRPHAPERTLFDPDAPRLEPIANAAVRRVAVHVLRQQVKQYAGQDAKDLASKTDRVDRIRKHLVHTLAGLVQPDAGTGAIDFPKFIAAVKTERKVPRRQLEGVHVQGKLLRNWLVDVAGDRRDWFERLQKGLRLTWPDLLGNQPAAEFASDTRFVDSIVGGYLLRYLNALARRVPSGRN